MFKILIAIISLLIFSETLNSQVRDNVEIENAIKSLDGKLLEIFQKHSRDSLLYGEVIVKITIEKNGNVSKVDITSSTLRNIEFEKDLKSIVSELKFSIINRNLLQEVSIPFEISSSEMMSKIFSAVESRKSATELYLQFIKMEDSIRTIQHERELREIEIKNKNDKDGLIRNSLILGIISLIIVSAQTTIALVANRRKNNKLKEAKKELENALEEVSKIKDEILRTNNELNTTITTLNKTQKQLISQEKLAALGEMAAGIAHEIQNPLNFVSNFSDVNLEFIEEIEMQIKKGELSIDYFKDHLEKLKNNSQIIVNHSKRASTIVSSMLKHASGASPSRQETELNNLITEYLNLAILGFNSNKNNIKINIKTKFDDSIPKMYVSQEEISRVLINIFQNALYSLNEKFKEIQTDEPELFVKTERIANNIVISIRDNGKGIPDEIKNKIFQPFFTTKKGGEGTGLGLSVSNDIIKSHGGKIEFTSRVNEYTEFIITL